MMIKPGDIGRIIPPTLGNSVLENHISGVAEGAYLSASDNIEDLLWECESGRELRAMDLPDDVSYAARLNLCETAPVLRGERLEKFVEGM